MGDSADSLDLEGLEAVGIANARGRADLIEYLDSLGFSAAEMVAAERRGRLFGLAGDALGWSGPPVYSLRTAADALGVTVEDVERAWMMLGLGATDTDTPALSQADLDGLATVVAVRAHFGDPADGFFRVLGVTMARLAEAESSMIRAGQPDVWLGHSHDEATTAQAWRATAEFIPRVGAMIDAVHRQHLVSVRTFLEGLGAESPVSMTCGVGFVDLSGFTALTQTLTSAELSAMLTAFSGTVADVVHAGGGRVVKFIGDSVMWVSATPAMLARTAIDLVDHPEARASGLRAHAGLGYGEMVTLGGDYYGNPVNLAARLAAAAGPDEILVASDVHDLLPDWPITAREALTLKGFDEPVSAYEVRHGDGERVSPATVLPTRPRSRPGSRRSSSGAADD